MHKKNLPSPKSIKKKYAVKAETLHLIQEFRDQFCHILSENDPKLMLIVGPCSIHNYEATIEYAKRLKALSEKVSEKIFIIMRVYLEKPRSMVGWKGVLYDPNLDGTDDLESGIALSRKLLVEISELGIPTATEILSPLSCLYFDDLITWACIGARTTLSQIHREIASMLPMPVAFKNDVSGDITGAIMSMIAADSAHSFIGVSEEGILSILESRGNPFTHIILRGGKNITNYDEQSIKEVATTLEKFGLMPHIIVDCAHDNCKKDIKNVPRVFEEVLHEFINGNPFIKGIMFESNLGYGKQPFANDVSSIKPDISITDACLGWPETEKLILDAYDSLKQSTFSKKS